MPDMPETVGADRAVPWVLAPTFLEYLASRLALGRYPVAHTGVGLSRWRGAPPGTAVVLCGVAGALAPGIAPGTVLVPERVGLADGSLRLCDARLVDALTAAARSFGFDVRTGPLLTTPALVTGEARSRFAARGFVAADMETARLPDDLRIATVRVVLDTPSRPISERWTHAAGAMLRPGLWPELVWLASRAPAYAVRAARIARAGVEAQLVAEAR